MSLETSNDHIQEKEQFAKRHKIKIEKEKHENLTLQRREKLLPSKQSFLRENYMQKPTQT